jgi:hypothetical protein
LASAGEQSRGFKRLKVDVDAFRGTRKELAASGLFLTAPSKKAAGKKTAAAQKTAAARTAAPAKKATTAKKVTAKKIGHSDDVPMMWRGRKLKTILMLQSAERRLGQRVVITQGSFNTTVGPSKGTHDRGGVFDVSVRGPGATINKKVRVLRREGFAA